MTFADSKGYSRDRGEGYQDFGQVSTFISAGQADEVFRHQFNYAAFRYVIVKGLPDASKPSDMSSMLIDSDLLFTIMTKIPYPGWEYLLGQGATTVWEQWDGFWSHIHSFFPSANNWLYQGLGRIQADPAGPGFKQFIIKPNIVGDVTWVETHYDSSYGRIVSNWRREGKLRARWDPGCCFQIRHPRQ